MRGTASTGMLSKSSTIATLTSEAGARSETGTAEARLDAGSVVPVRAATDLPFEVPRPISLRN